MSSLYFIGIQVAMVHQATDSILIQTIVAVETVIFDVWLPVVTQQTGVVRSIHNLIESDATT